jgi:hypothetical protein
MSQMSGIKPGIKRVHARSMDWVEAVRARGRQRREPPPGISADQWRSVVKFYRSQLGLRGGISLQQHSVVLRCATLAIICERVRTEALKGAATISDVDKAERSLRGAERELRRLSCDVW